MKYSDGTLAKQGDFVKEKNTNQAWYGHVMLGEDIDFGGEKIEEISVKFHMGIQQIDYGFEEKFELVHRKEEKQLLDMEEELEDMLRETRNDKTQSEAFQQAVKNIISQMQEARKLID